MITVGMNYQIIPGKEQVFESMFKSVVTAMQSMPHHQKSTLFTEVDTPNKYLILSEWNDRQAFDDFISSDQFRNVANWGKEQVLAGRPSHEYYEK